MSPDRRVIERLENLVRRLDELPPLAKKLLLIRPTVRGDHFSRISYGWAENVKEKAIAEGWEVEDLGGEGASRMNIESALSRIAVERPRMVIHYDHGSEFTLYGHTPVRPRRPSFADLVPVIDESNVAVLAGTFVSAMACSSAAGLGPLAIYERASGYLGYASLLAASFERNDRFGEAVNAPNLALLEGKSPAEAYEIGWQAWDRLSMELWLALGRRTDYFTCWDWSVAQHNRDCFTLLQP